MNPLGRSQSARLQFWRFYHRRVVAGSQQVISAAGSRFGAQHVFVGRAELFAQAQIGQKVVDQSGNPGDVGEGVDLILDQAARLRGSA
jgi:hypothetical protein